MFCCVLRLLLLLLGRRLQLLLGRRLQALGRHPRRPLPAGRQPQPRMPQITAMVARRGLLLLLEPRSPLPERRPVVPVRRRPLPSRRTSLVPLRGSARCHRGSRPSRGS